MKEVMEKSIESDGRKKKEEECLKLMKKRQEIEIMGWEE